MNHETVTIVKALHKQLISRVNNGESAEEVIKNMARDLVKSYPSIAKQILEKQ